MQKKLKSTKVEDRDIKVFNAGSGKTNLKTYFQELDAIEQERLAQLQVSEEKLENQISRANALKLVAENEKNSVFHSKKQEELERVRNQQVYTTSLIRIRFPDDYVIQGTFAALERVQVIYNFVKENLANPDREFYLYETPPKKIIKDLTLTAKAARLVPSGVLYFAWADLDQTLNTDGPFLDMFKLKDKITGF